MKSILLRDLDQQIYNALKRMARMHHRSLQGELHAILEWAVKMAPSLPDEDELQLITVRTGKRGGFSREEMYEASGR